MNDLMYLRKKFQKRLSDSVIRIRTDGLGERYPNFANSRNRFSVNIAWGIVNYLGYPISDETTNIRNNIRENFESIIRYYLQSALAPLLQLRASPWQYSADLAISEFDQYKHLGVIKPLLKKNNELGKEYILTPDIVVGSILAVDNRANFSQRILSPSESLATSASLQRDNITKPHYTLHTSLSCKWTLSSDDVKNVRTEVINLIRDQNGNSPRIAVVTAEPLPIRISVLAFGVREVDCVYHFALHELKRAIETTGNDDQLETLNMMIEGRRLRDISDLPFDLAI